MAKRGRPKKGNAEDTRLERAWKAIDALLDSPDPKDKAQGARLFAQYQKGVTEEDKTAVDQTVAGIVELVMRLETELSMTGEQIIAIIGEQIGDVEQLIRRGLPELPVQASGDAV